MLLKKTGFKWIEPPQQVDTGIKAGLGRVWFHFLISALDNLFILGKYQVNFFFFFLGLHPWYMEVPWLGVE